MALRDEIVGPIVLFFCLFFPMIAGVFIPLLALYYRGMLGWLIIALIIIDYAVPMSRRAWPAYNSAWISPLAAAFRGYTPGNCLKIDPAMTIEKDRKYLFCAHPHGVFGFYVVSVMDFFAGKGIYMTCFAAPILCMLPLARRHFSWMGMMAADAKNMRKMNKNTDYPNNVFWSTPGGIEEAFCVPDAETEQIVVAKRKGFCKIALQCGTDLIPVYGFGNNQFFPVISGNLAPN